MSTLEINEKMKDVVIIGGGLAGLLSALQLAREGLSVCVIEKKSFPFHRVCGEYISNEVVPFLQSLGVFPEQLHPTNITQFQLSAVNGKSATLPLDLGGFGISRYNFDLFLYEKAKQAGVTFILNTEVQGVSFHENHFLVSHGVEKTEARLVLGCFGKRSKLDVALNRKFISKRSPYVGVKYHVRTDFPSDLVALHNFEGGYCGVSNVENNITNLCYLVNRDLLRRHGNIAKMETAVLIKNPHLKKLFTESEFLFEKPETINEISFATKEPVQNHMLMIGDAAGMITPLCGNGMAMAIRSSKIASELATRFMVETNYSRQSLENDYTKQWTATFSKRLWFGRQVQKLFGSKLASNMAIKLIVHSPFLAHRIVKGTHGEVF